MRETDGRPARALAGQEEAPRSEAKLGEGLDDGRLLGDVLEQAPASSSRVAGADGARARRVQPIHLKFLRVDGRLKCATVATRALNCNSGGLP